MTQWQLNSPRTIAKVFQQKMNYKFFKLFFPFNDYIKSIYIRIRYASKIRPPLSQLLP
jgi:hypothetical protein